MSRQPHEPYALMAARFKALADPTRLRLLARLRDGEICVGELADGVGGTQPNVSKHLAVLRQAGLVRASRRGMRVCYSVADPQVWELWRTMREAVCREARRMAAELPPDTGARRTGRHRSQSPPSRDGRQERRP